MLVPLVLLEHAERRALQARLVLLAPLVRPVPAAYRAYKVQQAPQVRRVKLVRLVYSALPAFKVLQDLLVRRALPASTASRARPDLRALSG